MISQFIRAVLSCNYPTLFWGERSFILVRIVGIWFLIYFGYANLLKLLAFQNNLSGLKTISGYLNGRRLKAPGGLQKIKDFVLFLSIIQMTERFKRSGNVFSELVCVCLMWAPVLRCAVSPRQLMLVNYPWCPPQWLGLRPISAHPQPQHSRASLSSLVLLRCCGAQAAVGQLLLRPTTLRSEDLSRVSSSRPFAGFYGLTCDIKKELNSEFHV